MQRLQVVLGHLRGPADSGSSAPSCGRFVSLGWAWGSGGHCGCSFCCRTPPPDELLSAVMTAVLKDVNLRPEQLGDICVDQHGVSYVFLFYIHAEMCCSLGPGQSWPESPSF
uniref:Uncharacterized protein n=1 Tax=Pan paniscus TaxID=9597 RepID=A0A2R9BZU5_PANPA